MRNFFLSLFLFSSFNSFSADRCTPNFETAEEKVNHLEGWLTSKAEAPNTVVYNKYKNLKTSHPQLVSVIPEHAVYDVLLDEEMLWTAKQLENVLNEMSSSLRSHPNLSHVDRFQAALRKNLEGKVPAHGIESRINEFMNGGTIFRALGEKTVEEVSEMFHGGNPLHPSANSILGQFIARHEASTVLRAFPHGTPDIYTTFGPEKLVVAVDRTMLADFHKMMADQHIFSHYHKPDQSTLKVMHEDHNFSWSGKNDYSNITDIANNNYDFQIQTIFPTVLLNSTEAQRMTQYLKAVSNYKLTQLALEPWGNNGYCAKGGYDSCTHWIGNIPIGDEVVDSYTLPGKLDRYASNSIHTDPALDKAPRTQNLIPFEAPANLPQAEKELLNRVWKVPGNKQLAYVLGLGKAQEYGQLANPGWVAHVLTSRVKLNRGPVVFVFVDDAKQPLAADFNLQISAK
ncbi:MAG: hypothetical protein ACOYL6_19110 [Bacteriovoracaceae bacterium]